MKKSKRLLSVLLAVLMAFSSFSVGFYAFAGEKTKAECDKEVASFVTIPVNRADIGGDVIWTKEGVQNTLDGLWDTAKTLLNTVFAMSDVKVNGKLLVIRNGLNEVVEGFVYQPEMVSAVFYAYAMLSHEDEKFYELLNTEVIANYLEQSDGKYDKVIEQIRAIEVTEEDKANDINDLDKLAEIEFTAADFGFKAGNKDGFIDAILAVIRPITSLMVGDASKPLGINMLDDGNKRGIYSLILNFLENIGLVNMPTPAEYKENYLKVKNAGGTNTCLDEILRPIIDSAFKNVIQPIIDKPIDGLIALVPRFADALNSGLMNDTIHNVAKAVLDTKTYNEYVKDLEITPEFVNYVLKRIEIPLDEEGKNILRFKAINFHILADCATVKTVKSSSVDRDYFVLRTGETDSVFVNLFYYIYEIIFADKQNFDAIYALLKENKIPSTFLRTIEKMSKLDRNAACGEFLRTFGKEGKTKLKRTKAAAQMKFVDIAGYEYYDDYLAYTSVYNQFLKGTNPGLYNQFSATTPITRAMFVTILYRMAGEPYSNGRNPYKTSPFTDITDKSVYYYDSACWALKKGITNQTTFKPFDNVSREQTATFLFRYAKENGLIYEFDENHKKIDLSVYSDYKSINPWAYEAMQWANFNGMITGTMQGTANPQGATQRIHATKILYGFGYNCDIGNFK